MMFLTRLPSVLGTVQRANARLHVLVRWIFSTLIDESMKSDFNCKNFTSCIEKFV